MDFQKYKKALEKAKERLENNVIDEIPLAIRPKTPDIDYNSESYVVVSYSRKDFVEVYSFLEYLCREGYRFWYDNGMKGDDTWINEFKEKYENPNCLGTITFFSENYISNSTKEELDIIYKDKQYSKHNMMISLVSLSEMDPERALKHAILNDRISILNAAVVEPVLKEIIEQEKSKTIHRYMNDDDIPFIAEKLEKNFCIRNNLNDALQQENNIEFFATNGVLRKYVGEKSEIVIPNGVTEIGEGAFSSCLDILSVTIPNGVTQISNSAFNNCMSLSKVTISNSVKYIWECAFQSCISLEDVFIPPSVTLIGDGAFCSCSDLKNVTLSEGIIDIYHEAFYGCGSLESVNIPKSVKFIGNGVFDYCDSLEYIVYEGTKAQWHCIDCGEIGVSRVKCIDGELELY